MAAAQVVAPAAWRTVECISDLHLQAADPATFEAWRRYMAATPADAVFILGDLFEAWPGDDAITQPGFDADCAAVLREAARRIPVHFLHGNRDFLVGEGLATATGLRLLQDPCVLAFGPERWLLTHGDALCLDDVAYQAFRAKVRQPRWQAETLALPLAQRQALAASLRQQSAAEQRVMPTSVDIDPAEALRWLAHADARRMVHGHTHRPAEHAFDAEHRRWVLSDWDATAQPPRLQALRLTADGRAERVALA